MKVSFYYAYEWHRLTESSLIDEWKSEKKNITEFADRFQEYFLVIDKDVYISWSLVWILVMELLGLANKLLMIAHMTAKFELKGVD